MATNYSAYFQSFTALRETTFATTGVHDVDGDGLVDLILSPGTFPPAAELAAAPLIFLNQGDGTFDLLDLPYVSGLVHPREIAYADFNGDGVDDIVIIGHGYDTDPFPGESNLLLLSDGNGSFYDASANLPADDDFSHSVAVGDINGDGAPDIYIGNIYGSAEIDPYLLLNDGTGDFTRHELDNLYFSLFAYKSTAAEFVDIDGDGVVELVQGNDLGFASRIMEFDEAENDFVFERNLPAGAFDRGGIAVDLQTADLDNDGRLDIVVSHTADNYDGASIQVLLQQSDGSFADATGDFFLSFDTSQRWIQWIELVDINADGLPDLITSQSPAQGPVAYLNTGGHFVAVEGDYTMNGADEWLINAIDEDTGQVIATAFFDGQVYAAAIPVEEYGAGISIAAETGITRSGTDQAEVLNGGAARDTLLAGDGADTVIGGGGDDTLIGGESEADLRDVIYGGDGNDSIDGGYGNDELRGDAGTDVLTGGFGADTVIGGTGDDMLTAQAWGDLLFGGAGDDFINGGFGYDMVNGGTGADRFFHLGVAGHGSDWIQDYDAGEGDVLVYGGSASLGQFQVNFATTDNAGEAGIEEAFVIYRPTGQILWALVDGGGQDSLNIQIGGDQYDLLA